ncbi:hypothetical protein RD792_003843 [Penstemon davidsonii]|uniref:Serine-threonine/tyrosine-protein kinase catalytic domain-containing protein n=1 Tax=Penstemon davidsonii TaxID=160366 RepID=A0ABR0DFS7_9LAMI|nr:hypothetical protein RD792_003843 [Penstemon davidsonii]
MLSKLRHRHLMFLIGFCNEQREMILAQQEDYITFGSVLFEVVCARAVINLIFPRDHINLAEWAMRWQREGSLENIIDSLLEGKYCRESLMKFVEISEKCLGDEGKSRPTMEYVLQLQEAWLRRNPTGDSSVSILRDLGPIIEGDLGSDLPTESKEHGESVLRKGEESEAIGTVAGGDDEFSVVINEQGS